MRQFDILPVVDDINDIINDIYDKKLWDGRGYGIEFDDGIIIYRQRRPKADTLTVHSTFGHLIAFLTRYTAHSPARVLIFYSDGEHLVVNLGPAPPPHTHGLHA
jgi:hypothetical protein